MDLDPHTPNDGYSFSIDRPSALSIRKWDGSVGPAQVIAESPAGQLEGTSLQESGNPPDGSQLPFTPTVTNSTLLPWGSLALVAASLCLICLP
jgi:hypothetical protein